MKKKTENLPKKTHMEISDVFCFLILVFNMTGQSEFEPLY